MAPTSPLVNKLKVHLKLSISRLRIVQAKDQAIAKQQRRAMAQLLEQGKVESARIRVENIIRSDLTTELHEILELYSELLSARIGLLDATPTCDPGLEEAVKSLIYAAPRTDIKELHQTRQLLVEKFGRDFATQAMAEGDKPAGQESAIPDRVRRKLRVEPPGSELVESYLKAIAHAYDVPYGDEEGEDAMDTTTGDADEDDTPGSGGQALTTAALEPALPAQELKSVTMTPPRDLGPRSPVSVAPPSPSTLNPNPRVRLPDSGPRPPALKPNARMKGVAALNGSVAPARNKPDGEVPDVDDLEKRFALLKK